MPFCEQYPNCSLIALEERKTLYEAWNIGWTVATAPIICYSNMDDVMHPLLLESVVNKMEKKHWDACTTLIIKQNLSEVKEGNWSVKNLKNLPLSLRPGPFTAWRSCLKETIGMFDTQLIVAGDKDFWARMLATRLKIGLISKVLYLYAKEPQHQLSKSIEGRKIRKQEEALLVTSKHYPIKWSYWLKWKIVLLRYFWYFCPRLFLTERRFKN